MGVAGATGADGPRIHDGPCIPHEDIAAATTTKARVSWRKHRAASAAAKPATLARFPRTTSSTSATETGVALKVPTAAATFSSAAVTTSLTVTASTAITASFAITASTTFATSLAITAATTFAGVDHRRAATSVERASGACVGVADGLKTAGECLNYEKKHDDVRRSHRHLEF